MKEKREGTDNRKWLRAVFHKRARVGRERSESGKEKWVQIKSARDGTVSVEMTAV